MRTTDPSVLIQPNPRRPPIETRELVAWIAAAGALGLALLFLSLLLARVREARRLRVRAAEAAGLDPLTTLLSRRAVLGVLEAEVARCLRSDASLGVLMMDFDHLSGLNEEHGRAAGDAVLLEGARRVRNNVRIYDSVGRCGGEEFLVILPDCPETELNDIAERVRMMIERSPIAWKGQQLRATISIGGLTTAALDEKSADRLVRSAEKLLGEAKGLGRNRVRITEPFELTEESSLGLALETERHPIDDGDA
ncbi:MAG: GGDEF domain-containing protein [Pseudomonadota bacterium]